MIALVEARNLDAEVLSLVERLDVSKEKVVAEIASNQCNSTTATYYLLEKQLKKKKEMRRKQVT